MEGAASTPAGTCPWGVGSPLLGPTAQSSTEQQGSNTTSMAYNNGTTTMELQQWTYNNGRQQGSNTTSMAFNNGSRNTHKEIRTSRYSSSEPEY